MVDDNVIQLHDITYYTRCVYYFYLTWDTYYLLPTIFFNFSLVIYNNSFSSSNLIIINILLYLFYSMT